MSVDPKQFWEEKIIPWETGRYAIGSHRPSGFLEKIGDWSSRSLRFRIHIAVELIRPFAAGKRILEIGCGSGLLAERFIEAGAQDYLGIDIAQNAIDAANARKKSSPGSEKIRFEVGTVRDMPAVSQDVVFSLGLLDWLNDDELRTLFQKQGHAAFLHAIAERRFSIQQWLHRNYIHICYGHRTGSYIPRYFAISEIARLLPAAAGDDIYVYRDPRLSFGALISSLPIGEAYRRK